MDNFETKLKVNEKNLLDYMANLLERAENDQVTIERQKAINSTLKQINNRSRFLLDVAKYQKKYEEATQDVVAPAPNKKKTLIQSIMNIF